MQTTHSDTSDDTSLETTLDASDITDRLEGIVSPAFHDKTILTLGVGAGSYAVEKLARYMPGTLINCDFDVVEPSNLARTTYTAEDAEQERLKVEALERRLHDIHPELEVESSTRNIVEMSDAEAAEFVEDVDLIVAGTDDFRAQARANELAVDQNIPALFIGVHARAEGGRLVWYLPGETGCYRCASPERYETAEQDELETMNLDGMVGGLIGCQFIDMVAMRVALALLERGRDSQMGRFYDQMAGRNEVIVRCHPDYDHGNRVWEALLADLPEEPKDYAEELKEMALFAMDSVWLPARRDEDCPVCGSLDV